MCFENGLNYSFKFLFKTDILFAQFSLNSLN